ncbi:MAG: phospho-sugar mutase, partial [Acholeplasmataceae bacterium]|nr:phospho-sugar mutase [Acholeplasmataceae bacterium]
MSLEKKYQSWLKEKNMPEDLLVELKKMDETTKKEAFHSDLEFGTGGLRGIMGAGTSKMNIFTIRRTTQGFANYLLKIPGANQKGVAIGYDNRHNSKLFAKEAAKVLATNGIKVYLFDELRPTPLTSFAVRYYNCAGGIMITASHNPKEYNGYKVYNDTGSQLNVKEADLVIEEVNKITDFFNIKAEESNLIIPILEEVENNYLENVRKIQINQTSKNAVILYSPLHGTGSTILPNFLRSEGYNLFEYEPHKKVDPNFSNAKVSNPEMPEAWHGMSRYGKEIGADVILLTDPDCDRVGVSVLHDGDYILLNGNQSAAITVYYLLSQRLANHILEKDGYVFSTIVTSDLILEIARHFNQNAEATLTGFKFIGQRAKEIEGKHKFQFGCEESIGSIISDFVRDKDGVQSVYNFAEIASYLKDNNLTMIDYLNQIHQELGYYLEYTHNLVLTGLEGAEKILNIMSHVRNNPLELSNLKMLKYDDLKASLTYFPDGSTQSIHLDKSNVLKYYYENNIWVVLRPSGTEPKLKIYFSVKSDSQVN